jgi:heterodisulfide reductase subunit A
MVNEKAKRLVSGAVKRVTYHSPAETQSVPVFPATLVIGGGIAGIQAALEIANSQRVVYLVEREPSIGGHMAQFDKTFPTLDCSACILTPKMSDIARNPYIRLLTYSEVVDVSGYVGNFTVKVKRKARCIDEDKCIGCGVCQEKCPWSTASEFDAGLGLRKAIYTPFPQAIPNIPVIDRERCVYFSGGKGKCRACEKFCEANAINFTQEDLFIDLQVGSIIIATGYDVFDPTPISEYGYGRLPNVFTSLEFERLCSPSGPTGGKLKLADGREPKSVAIVHCVGSRDQNYHKYCSRVCCMYALKYSHLFKEKTGGDVYQIYIDMRCSGKGYEEFYERVQGEQVNFVRGKLAKISGNSTGPEEEEKLIVTCEDTLLGGLVNIPVDMVILCVALQPRHDAEKIARILHLGRSQDGFFLERHPKLDPVATMSEGIFIVGCCQGPKDIPETVAQASAAAARALAMITRGKMDAGAIIASIDENLCSGCKICNLLCPYNAISFDEISKVSRVNQVLCKGCNICGAACPSSAISTRNFSSKQIMAEIEGVLA